MLYSNVNLQVETRKMSFGELSVISLGEKGRGRKEIILPSMVDIKFGMNEGVTIGLTKNGRPRINKVDSHKDNSLYLLIDTYGGYTRRGNGYITFREDQGFEIISEGNGADGDAGRIGTWSVYVIKAPIDDKFKFIKIQYSGKDNRVGYIAVIGRDVKMIDEDNLDIFFDQMNLDIVDYKYVLDPRNMSVPDCTGHIYAMEDVVNMDIDNQFFIGKNGELRHRDSFIIDASTMIEEKFAVEVICDDDARRTIYKVCGKLFCPISDWEKEMIKSKNKLGY